jgi:hypothetical protein
LHKQHGNNWKAIAEKVGRYSYSCKDKWREAKLKRAKGNVFCYSNTANCRQNSCVVLLTTMPLTILHWVAGKWTLEEFEKLRMLVHTSLRVNAQLKKDPSDTRVDHRHVSLEFCLWFSQFFAFYMIFLLNGLVMTVLNLFHVACT